MLKKIVERETALYNTSLNPELQFVFRPYPTRRNGGPPLSDGLKRDASQTTNGRPPGLKFELSFSTTRVNLLQEILYTPSTMMFTQSEGIHILKEIHNGCCGVHARTWVLANKALSARYLCHLE
ncbi:UNVERIFIED_CONTAM: hypothetical protein Sindi_0938800 [Sesamum indicum]